MFDILRIDPSTLQEPTANFIKTIMRAAPPRSRPTKNAIILISSSATKIFWRTRQAVVGGLDFWWG